MAKETKMAKEAAANATPSTALAIFQTGGEVDMSKMKRRNMPQMVKAGDVPVDAVITAEIVDVVDSPVSTVKGKLLWLRAPNGQEFTFPCTGVIRNALAPGKDDKEVKDVLEKLKGKTLVLKRTPDKQSAKFKKNMFMFDVFTN